MNVCECGHLADDHAWDGEHSWRCHMCDKCEGFEQTDDPHPGNHCPCLDCRLARGCGTAAEMASLRGRTGAYARIEAHFDKIMEQVDAILAAEEDVVKRSSLAAEIGLRFVQRYHEFRTVQRDVDAETAAVVRSK